MLRVTLLLSAVLFALALGAPEERILNGDIVQSPEEYPYKCNVRNLGRFKCGCVILSELYILTSARCADILLLRDMTVSIGSNHLSAGNTVHDIRRRTEHYDFNVNDYFSPDISVLEVEIPMVFSPTVGPVILPNATQETLAGDPAVVIGWGFTSASGPESPSLMEANATVMDHAACASWYAGQGVLPDTIICTTNTGGGVCNHDNGGPMLVRDVLHGIITWTSSECATLQGFPGVYTRVASFRQWITDITGL